MISRIRSLTFFRVLAIAFFVDLAALRKRSGISDWHLVSRASRRTNRPIGVKVMFLVFRS